MNKPKIKPTPVTGVEGTVKFGGTFGINPMLLVSDDGGNYDVLSNFLKKFEGKKVRLYVEVVG
jgi:hypothetical protein